MHWNDHAKERRLLVQNGVEGVINKLPEKAREKKKERWG